MTTDVGGLGLVEKQVRFRGVLIDPVLAQKETERDQRVEKVRSRARVETEPALKCGEIRRVFCQFGENFHFHSAEESLGGPEGHAGLKDVIGGRIHGEDSEIHDSTWAFNPLIHPSNFLPDGISMDSSRISIFPPRSTKGDPLCRLALDEHGGSEADNVRDILFFLLQANLNWRS